ncbi:uncharacterized protein TM35_000031210, partial [Trypanosoma theileri]
ICVICLCISWTFTFAFGSALKLSSPNCVPARCFWWYDGGCFSSNASQSAMNRTRSSKTACGKAASLGIAKLIVEGRGPPNSWMYLAPFLPSVCRFRV